MTRRNQLGMKTCLRQLKMKNEIKKAKAEAKAEEEE
jgi:hypothetical protein